MKHHRLPAWLACLALLLHLLSMPLSDTLPADAGRLLSGNGHAPVTHADAHQLHGLHVAATTNEHEHGDHGGMPPCCCAGTPCLAALPGTSAPILPDAAGPSYAGAERRTLSPSPRERWPALNPRASPLA